VPTKSKLVPWRLTSSSVTTVVSMALLCTLEIGCPAPHHLEEGVWPPECRKLTWWYHSNCTSTLKPEERKSQLYGDLTLKCPGCELKRHLRHWRFFCKSRKEYKETTQLSFANALRFATATFIGDIEMLRAFTKLQDLIVNDNWDDKDGMVTLV